MSFDPSLMAALQGLAPFLTLGLGECDATLWCTVTGENVRAALRPAGARRPAPVPGLSRAGADLRSAAHRAEFVAKAGVDPDASAPTRIAAALPATLIRSSLVAFGRRSLQLEPPSRVGVLRGFPRSHENAHLAIAIAGYARRACRSSRAASNQARSVEQSPSVAATEFSAAKRHKKAIRKQVRTKLR